MTQDDEANDEENESEETITPGDLMAFAWQISEGMVRCFKLRYCSMSNDYPAKVTSQSNCDHF